jgi:hypothetical protein
MGVEQVVGDFRTFLQGAANGGRDGLAGFAAQPRPLADMDADTAHAAYFVKTRGDDDAHTQLFSARVSSRIRRSLPGLSSNCSRPQSQAPGGQGWRNAGELVMGFDHSHLGWLLPMGLACGCVGCVAVRDVAQGISAEAQACTNALIGG